MQLPTFDDVVAAHERIRPHVHRTPVLTSSHVDGLAGARLFLKCENLQKIGAFKARGACNAVFGLSEAQASALTISGVTSRVDATGMRPVLFVDGEAANDGAAAATLPPLQIRVTDNDGRITRYTLGTSDRWLSPGERFGFASRLDVPRNGVKTVSVTFAE